jgi:hypothetical protein
MVPPQRAVAGNASGARNYRQFPALIHHDKRQRGNIMPLLIPVLIGIPVVIGGGWYIFHLAH